MARIANNDRRSVTIRTGVREYVDHKPKGYDSDLEKAMQLLGAPPAVGDETKSKIVQVVGRFLRFINVNSPRVADDLARLETAERLARRLDATLASLSIYPLNKLGGFIPKASFHGHRSLGNEWFMLEYLDCVALAAKATRLDLLDVFGNDKGGKNVTVNSLTFGKPHTWLMEDLIKLYAEVNGASTVTSTTTRKVGGCYNFIDAVHRYATGEAVEHSSEYKRLVRRWKERRITREKGA